MTTPHLPWSNSLLTGHPVVDTHHRSIVEFINHMLTGIETGLERSHMIEMALHFERLVREHFQHEEQVLSALNHPQAAEHAMEHNRYLDALQLLHLNMGGFEQLELFDMVKGLGRFFLVHMGTEDQCISQGASVGG